MCRLATSGFFLYDRKPLYYPEGTVTRGEVFIVVHEEDNLSVILNAHGMVCYVNTLTLRLYSNDVLCMQSDYK